MAYNEVQDLLIEAINNVVEEKFSQTNYDKSTYVIVTSANQKSNLYDVLYNGQTITNIPCDQGILSVGDRTLMTFLDAGRKVLVGKSGINENTAGNGIEINTGQISAKVDGDTVYFNQQGQLCATGGGGGGTTYYAGAGLNLNSTTHTFSTSVDDDTIKINSSNKLYVAKGGTTYTAGTNIDITNNVISATDTKYDLASDTKDGLMNHSHYSKLQGIAAGADKSNNGVLTIKQNGVSKGTFTANQAGASTVELTDTTYTAGTGISIVDGVISLSLHVIQPTDTFGGGS